MNQNLIEKIVKASGIQPGESVLLHFWGEDADRQTAKDFLVSIAALGASPFLLQESRTLNRDLFSRAAETCFRDAYFNRLDAFDTVLDVFAYQPVVLGYEIESETLLLYRRYMANLFRTLLRAKRFLQIRLPTVENAAESSLAPDEFVRRMTAAYDIDFDALHDCCQAAENSLKAQQRITIQTGDQYRLQFDLSGRCWHIDAGDGDWPCGEVYIAPNETKTQGQVFFDVLYLDGVGRFENVWMKICRGSLVESNNEAINRYLRNLKPEDKVVCELGFGMNPNVTEACGYTVLDEKIKGSFHIAIGENTMFGGCNRAARHVDLVHTGPFQIMQSTGGHADDRVKC